jgi:hypothetical protein
VATARQRHCNAAPELDVTAGERFVWGVLAGASAFSSTCADTGPFPDSVVKLKLTAPVARLVVTTDNSSTRADTVLSVLSGACDESPTVLGCNDDTRGVSTLGSTVELVDVAAGTYVVVVDSIRAEGGSFLLKVDTP